MSNLVHNTLALTIDEMRTIFGSNDAYIKKIEDKLKVEITDRGGQLNIVGEKGNVEKAMSIIKQLTTLSE